MASSVRARASAQAPSLPTTPCACHDQVDTEALAHPRSVASLALEADDELSNLQDVHRAYACLERLICPAYVRDSDEVSATRSELSALVLLVNKELERRIERAATAIQSVRQALEGGAQ